MTRERLSVTLPHKENALRYLQEKNATVEELAVRIGAVNTIVIEDGGRLRGFNTDYAAILDSITDKLQIARAQLARARVASMRLRLQPSTLLAGIDAIDAAMGIDAGHAESEITRVGDAG